MYIKAWPVPEPSSIIIPPWSGLAEPEFNSINLSSTNKLAVSMDVVVPCTVKSPVKVKEENVGLSPVWRPVSISVLAPFIVALTVPCEGELNEEPDITPSALSLDLTPPVKVLEAVSNSILSALATIPLLADTTLIVLVVVISPPPVKPVPAVIVTP